MHFARHDQRRRTVMKVIALDRPGSLSEIGSAIQACDAHPVDARVATFGERAQDAFYITDSEQRPFSDAGAQQQQLRALIVAALA